MAYTTSLLYTSYSIKMRRDRAFRLRMVFWCVLACLFVSTDGAGPVFTNLEDLYLGENEVDNRLLHLFTIDDPEGNLFTCDVTGIRSDSSPGGAGVGCPGGGVCPTGDEFTILRNPQSGLYQFDLAGSPPAADFTYLTETPYEARVVCEDDTNDRTTATVTIHIIAGEIIWWDTPLPSNVPVDAKTFGVNSLIETAQASNNNGDAMTYSIIGVSSDLPGTDPWFAIDGVTGEITNLQDFYTIPLEDGNAYYVDVVARDANNQLKIYGRVTVNLDLSQNVRPISYEFPLSDTLSEDTPIGTTLFSMNAQNPEGDQTVTSTQTCTPSTNIFTFDANLNFILTSNLDYDTATSYICEFVLNDGFHDSISTYTYQLTVTNVNDPPQFDSPMYYATFNEGDAAGVTVDPQLVCTDAEGPVTYALVDSGNSSRFRINPTTGVLWFGADYEVDGTDAWPIVDTIEVECVDAGDGSGAKLTATAEITVAINDANDNAPDLLIRCHTWYSNNSMEPGYTVIGKLEPTDIDSGPNRQVECTATSTSPLAAYYKMQTTCELVLWQTIDFDPGTRVRFEVTATDLGNPALSTGALVDVIYQDFSTTTTTTTTTAAPDYNFWDNGGSVAVFIMTLLGLLGLLAAGLYVCLRGWLYGWGNLWPRCDCLKYRQFPDRHIKPVTPPRTPPPRERTPIIREKAPPPETIIERPEPQRVLVKRTIVNVPRPGVAPFAPMQGIPLVRGTPPSLLAPGPFPS